MRATWVEIRSAEPGVLKRPGVQGDLVEVLVQRAENGPAIFLCCKEALTTKNPLATGLDSIAPMIVSMTQWAWSAGP